MKVKLKEKLCFSLFFLHNRDVEKKTGSRRRDGGRGRRGAEVGRGGGYLNNEIDA